MHKNKPDPMNCLMNCLSGTLTNWKQVSGPNKAIHVITRDEASGSREMFWQKALRKGLIRQDADVVSSNGAMKTATDPASIGYMSVGYVDETIRALTLNGVHPLWTMWFPGFTL